MPVKSILGNRLGISRDGVLRVDGRDLRGKIPTLGTDIFVDSVTGDDNHSGLTPEMALATLDAAFAKTTANKGDVIYVMPNHSETVTGAGGIAHDVAGVSVIGLGRGGQRPRFLMDGATTVTYLITAADALVRNCVFAAGFADVVTCFSIIAGTDAWIDNCEFIENTTAENFVTPIKAGTADNASDGLRVSRCRYLSPDATTRELVEVTGDMDRMWVHDNLSITGDATGGTFIKITDGDDIQHALVVDNAYICQDTSAVQGMLITDQTNNTGVVADNLVGCLDTAGEVMTTGENSGLYTFQNYSSSVVTASGYLLPAADTA